MYPRIIGKVEYVGTINIVIEMINYTRPTMTAPWTLWSKVLILSNIYV